MSAKPILTVIVADKNSKLADFPIGDKQLIFVGDQRKIAVDFNGKRTFYNQIEVLKNESERQAIIDPKSGLFYFTCDPGTLWYFDKDWICVAAPSNDTVYIGTSLPSSGEENTLYVDKKSKNISVWDPEINAYVVVGEAVQEISEEEIDSLFS